MKKTKQNITGTEGKKTQELLVSFDDRYQKIVEEIKGGLSSGCKILDIGCGEAKIWLLFPGLAVTGVDISPANIVKAKKYLKRALIGKAERLPFKDNYFNLILASEILEHMVAPEKALAEISRVLAPGGKAIVTYPNTGGLQIRLSLLLWGRNPTINYPDNQLHLRFFSLAGFKALVVKTKLEIKKVRGCSFLAFHQENFGCYIPIPRSIRLIGGDLFPGLSLGNLVVLEKKKR